MPPLVYDPGPVLTWVSRAAGCCSYVSARELAAWKPDALTNSKCANDRDTTGGACAPLLANCYPPLAHRKLPPPGFSWLVLNFCFSVLTARCVKTFLTVFCHHEPNASCGRCGLRRSLQIGGRLERGGWSVQSWTLFCMPMCMF